jgi:23S rRNA U2552 (ribose-2'-O)-methylase RlmE/FtsJ
MIYFLLPHNYTKIYNYIDYITDEKREGVVGERHCEAVSLTLPLGLERGKSPFTVGSPTISESLYSYLYEIKEKMNSFQSEWDVCKKYTNPFEYIHTPCPTTKRCISAKKPLSRSYFKMIEMYKFFTFDFGKDPIQTFHLAEGPGGFIEAIAHLRSCKGDVYTGMTLQDNKNDHNIPAWKKSDAFLRENSNVKIENGITGTGDILSVDNFVACVEKYKSSMMFITGDGGFDFSENFNEQEKNIGDLLFSQIAFSLCLQKRGGAFILKIFDFFMSHTIDLLYLLSSFYEKVYITKPDTSRYANSEKYLVCIGFLYNDCDSFYPILLSAFKKMTDNKSEVCRFLTKPISYYFKMKLEEFNICFGQQQIENISSTIALIENNDSKYKNNKINDLIKINSQKCVNWCIKYGVSNNS